MSKYHYLIASLPEITLDDSKQVYSVFDFKGELENTLSSKDKKLISFFFLKYDNRNLLNWLQHESSEQKEELSWDKRGTLSPSIFEETAYAIKEGKKMNKHVPSYMGEFLTEYFDPEVRENKEEISIVSWEDKLTTRYYAYAVKCKNKFFSEWFKLNLTIKNILVAITCNKYGFDKKQYIIGDDEIAENLRASNSRELNVGEDVEYLSDLLRLADESDLAIREKKIDVLKWEWLEYNTVFKVFDIESVFAYLLKIEMIERWTNLDKASGEASFRELISAMKKDSNSALNEFKKKNNKI
ncbi:MAG: DUF2764 family protein [Massilibacteroides sp.]|nr:DUF2764 family protein [Massilibacteroides sp.]MDD3061657.1 DUF2764 family protein [Massilibacteroides sp.]MDD4114300.1 DUF2764 family protein [Massilibacteroides sp.]MDD4659959.1 DUF2764 family protein [Massilibacteroides sp.]